MAVHNLWAACHGSDTTSVDQTQGTPTERKRGVLLTHHFKMEVFAKHSNFLKSNLPTWRWGCLKEEVLIVGAKKVEGIIKSRAGKIEQKGHFGSPAGADFPETRFEFSFMSTK